MHSNLWIEERYKDFYGMRYKVENVLYSKKTEFQTVDVVETKGHGKMLLNDGLVMVTERDEIAYHDMISHVPLFVHPNPKNVLVIGGGDGGTAREVLRHASVEKCTMVEIDGAVCEACMEFIPQTAEVLKGHPKLDLIIGDGVKFVQETTEKFDVIIIDSTDPIGPAAPLFGPEFYTNVNKCLADNGIVVSQGESPWFEAEIQKSMLGVLNDIFKNTFIYNFSNLTYPGGLWSFTFATKGDTHPINDFREEAVAESGLEFSYYNAGLHKAAFYLPTFMKKNLEGLIQNP
ncbi:polyamine aminopropyltransferase [Halobacteriovorax sp. XZX-3]|uniref:polyamine aminopropyltransferase n=1 Tax=unclassified Halobacteriovorax TaxID=2639665 RepID=UPI000CD156FB|nr:polyamine aminopropyltransferase [Halobacteriovorax sp. DA5]POB14255.1 spermidine synthase [Halobacteriovorax sp. DA5]